MAGGLANFAAAFGGLTRTMERQRRHEREDMENERLKLSTDALRDQAKLTGLQTKRALEDDQFNAQLRATMPSPEEMQGLDRNGQILKHLEARENFALQNNRPDIAFELRGKREKVRQDMLDSATKDAFRSYEQSGDLNDLTKPFGMVNDGRTNFRFEGDDAKGYALSFDMKGKTNPDGTPYRHTMKFANRGEAEQAAYGYINPLERMKNENEFYWWNKKAGVNNDAKMDALQTRFNNQLALLEEKMRLRDQYGAGKGGSGNGSRNPNGGDGSPDAKDTLKNFETFAKNMEGVPPGPEGSPPPDAAKGFEVYSRLRDKNPGANDAALMRVGLLVGSGAATLSPEINPATGAFALYAPDEQGRRWLVDDNIKDTSKLVDHTGKPLLTPEVVKAAQVRHVEALRTQNPQMLSDATVLAYEPAMFAKAEQAATEAAQRGQDASGYRALLNTAAMLREIRQDAQQSRPGAVQPPAAKQADPGRAAREQAGIGRSFGDVLSDFGGAVRGKIDLFGDEIAKQRQASWAKSLGDITASYQRDGRIGYENAVTVARILEQYPEMRAQVPPKLLAGIQTMLNK